VRRYLLARHVFLCVVNEQAILLDLRHDRYLALDKESSRHLIQVVSGWPAVPEEQRDGQQAIDATVAELLGRGLITPDPLRGKLAGAVVTPLPTQTLLPAEIFLVSRSGWRHMRVSRVVAVLVAAIKARLWLRLGAIEWIVKALSRTPGQPAAAEGVTKQLVVLFYELRPFLFSARNACLFDSLALLLLLRRFGVFPQWIFGVRTGPFAAHCWLQSGHVVLNDTVEHVRSYTPIMCV
jgi:hypothetical protein